MFQCIINIFVLATLAYAIIQLAPAVALNQLHVGKAGYGFLVATYGVGLDHLQLLPGRPGRPVRPLDGGRGRLR